MREALIVICIISVVCAAFLPIDDKIVSVSASYSITEAHVTYIQGTIFYDIMYVVNGKIENLLVDTDCLTIYQTDGPAKLVWVNTVTHGFCKYNTYALYMPKNMHFAGQNSEWTVSTGKSSHEEQSIMS